MMPTNNQMQGLARTLFLSTGPWQGTDPGPGPCATEDCGNTVPSFEGPTTRASSRFPEGRTYFRPPRCNDCRRATFAAMEAEAGQEVFTERRTKCAGHQNVTLSHLDAQTGNLFVPTVETFRETAEQAGAYEHLVDFLEGRRTNGAFIHGAPGTGKTVLAKVLNNALVAAKRDVAFLTDQELITALRSTQGRGATMQLKDLLADLSSVAVLIIDDYDPNRGKVGTGFSNDEVDFKLTQYFAILNARYEHARPTFLTSNFNATDAFRASEKIGSRLSTETWIAPYRLGGRDLRDPKTVATLTLPT